MIEMIEMIFAGTIVLVIAAVVLLVAPWWLTGMILAAGVLLLDRLTSPSPGAAPDEEEG